MTRTSQPTQAAHAACERLLTNGRCFVSTGRRIAAVTALLSEAEIPHEITTVDHGYWVELA